MPGLWGNVEGSIIKDTVRSTGDRCLLCQLKLLSSKAALMAVSAQVQHEHRSAMPLLQIVRISFTAGLLDDLHAYFLRVIHKMLNTKVRYDDRR